MPTRRYLSPVALAPTGNYRPTVWAALTSGSIIADARADVTLGTGLVVVETEATPAQHTAALAIAGVQVLPLEDVAGNALPLTATIGDVPAAKRTTINTRLESIGVPVQGWTLQTPLSDVMRRIIRRVLIRRILDSDDFSEGLDTLVSAVPVAKRQRIATALQARGFDTSDIVGTDTIREALRKLAAQEIPFFRGT